MSEYVKLATDAGDQYLTALAEIQENFLKSMTASSDATPAGPRPCPPFAADLPTPQEVAEANFAFAEKLLKQQKAFAEKLLATHSGDEHAKTAVPKSDGRERPDALATATRARETPRRPVPGVAVAPRSAPGTE